MIKKLLIVVAVIVVLGAAVALWKNHDAKVRAAKMEAEAKAAKLESEILKGLTEEEIVLILKNQSFEDPSKTWAIVQTAESRKVFLNGMKEFLSLAAKARREGMTEEPNLKSNLEQQKNAFLAGLYGSQLRTEQRRIEGDHEQMVEAVWTNPENEKQFNEDIQAVKAVQTNFAQSLERPLPSTNHSDEVMQKTRKSWARTKILADLAKADANFMQQKVVDLRTKINESGFLASAYLTKHWAKSVKPTNEEVSAFLAAHPEYNISKKRELAETVLQRAKAGEDFAVLAREFSEDRSTKGIGGLYVNQIKGDGGFWKEIEETALSLEKGQVADKIVETETGYHIVKFIDKRTKKQDGNDVVEYDVSHILLQKKFLHPFGSTDPDIPPAFITAEEVAKTVIEAEKRKKFVDGVINSENITLPEDFNFEITEEFKNAVSAVDKQRSLQKDRVLELIEESKKKKQKDSK